MRDVYECALLYLGVALRHPGAQAFCVQLGMPGQRRADGVDDIVQEIGLMGRRAAGTSENHPITAAGGNHIHPRRSPLGTPTPAGSRVPPKPPAKPPPVN